MSYAILTMTRLNPTVEKGVSEQEIIRRAKATDEGKSLELLLKSHIDGEEFENPNLLQDAINILSCGKRCAIFDEDCENQRAALNFTLEFARNFFGEICQEK